MVHVRYPEQDVAYHVKELGEITLAYAITVHKSQGSEYQTVIMALVNSHAIMLQRNLFYTAVRGPRKSHHRRRKSRYGTSRHQRADEPAKTLLAERIRGEEIL